jgi:hypothetical protein
MNQTPFAKPSALDALRALGQKKPVQSASPIAAQVNDPAIAGARKDKNTVVLGLDPAFADVAAHAAGLKAALEKAAGEFEAYQGRIRDYGFEKRGLYNDTFKASVTTVKVPYLVDDPSAQGVRATEHVSVICSNKYSVSPDVLQSKAEIGESFGRLFVEETSKSLRPNAEELIRGVFEQVGVQGEELENAMQSLFETRTTVRAAAEYEREERAAPEPVRALLKQMVTRAQPGLKFPG